MSQASSQRLQILDRYQNGDRNFREIDLRLVDLSRVKLFQADFAQAGLSGVNFTEADLRQVSFAQANLSQANFQGADLRGADLAGANLRRANLTGADLRNVQLTDAQLTGATMPDGRLFTATTPIEATLVQAGKVQPDLPQVGKPDFQRHPKVIVPPLTRSFAQVKADLPYWPLVNLGIGFLLIGMQLAMSKSAALFYTLPLLALLVFCFLPRFGSLLPIALLWVLLLSIGDPRVLVFPGLIVAAVFTYMKWMGPGMNSNPLRDTLWISAVLIFLIVIYCFLLFQPATALMMAVLIPMTGFGCLSLVDMNVKRFHRYEIVLATQLVAVAGLLIGGTIGAVIW